MTSLSSNVQRNLLGFVEAANAGAIQAAEEVGRVWVVVIQGMISRPQRSLPGEPPGTDTGGLILSYRYEVGTDTAGRVTVLVGSDESTVQPVPDGERVIYAGWLEFGTSKMEPRPHMRPAAEIMRQVAPRIVADVVAVRVREQMRRGPREIQIGRGARRR